MLLGYVGCLRWIETNLRRERQLEGIQPAKEKGVYKGGKKKINVELFWNELIYTRYKDLVKIDKEEIIKKVNKLDNDKQTEYLLSEISFTKKKNISVNELINEIQLSINEIGFNISLNTDNRLMSNTSVLNELAMAKLSGIENPEQLLKYSASDSFLN